MYEHYCPAASYRDAKLIEYLRVLSGCCYLVVCLTNTFGNGGHCSTDSNIP